MRYFYIVFQIPNGPMGYMTMVWESMPPRKDMIREAEKICAKKDFYSKEIAITNIIEFKNEQDYNDFVK